jgi:hypothetical protein
MRAMIYFHNDILVFTRCANLRNNDRQTIRFRAYLMVRGFFEKAYKY